ncbi:hypothetical protein RND71_008573 [Anisodus tanguticus]|uniref:Disease resistance R13L4/SHOC-2-like LRR domain-containing protein n=1 Tax=Anisodus tanguticus TaxID=243964 RepID=A0AAE1SNZ6_9SOLA|nr:hypothetical protein RND71_008573 [Anisodus tanguticus]
MHDLVDYIAEAVVDGECSTIVSHSQNISKYVRHIALSDYDLSGKELPRSLADYSMLRTIFFPVQGVGLTSTSFVIACISRFKHLWLVDLSDSCFEVLPNSIEELKHLKYLDVSANAYMHSLPNAICQSQSLQTLRVAYYTKLEVLPSYTENMINLRHLYMTTRQDVFSDKVIGCLRVLRSLYTYSCKNLVSLSDGLQHQTSLRTLTIVGCPRLTFLPSSMKYLTALKRLSTIDCEELTLLEWQDIEALERIEVSECRKLFSLPEGMHGLTNLKVLTVDSCPKLSEACQSMDKSKINHIPKIILTEYSSNDLIFVWVFI